MFLNFTLNDFVVFQISKALRMAAKEKDKDTADLWLENIEEDVRELYVNFSGVQGERSIQIRQEGNMAEYQLTLNIYQ